MDDRATLNHLAEAEIERLRENGVELTPAEIVKLNSLGWDVQTPETRRHLSRGVPVEVAGVYLWPLSLYAQDWFDRVGSRMRGEIAQGYALAYAMAYGRAEGEPLAISGRAARKTVKRWGKKLKCTYGEMAVAMEQVLTQEEESELPPDKTASGGMSFGEFSAFLASACGGDPDFWERRCSSGYTHAVLTALAKQNDADGKSTAGDARIHAERALGWAAEKIEILRGNRNPPDGYKVENGEIVEVDNGQA